MDHWVCWWIEGGIDWGLIGAVLEEFNMKFILLLLPMADPCSLPSFLPSFPPPNG